jgi:rhodanese-related sulfurtransferase
MCACVDFRPSLRPAAQLAAIAGLLAAASLLWHPLTVPSPDSISATATTANPPESAANTVSVATARKDPRFQNPLWVDARSAAAFSSGHIAAAIRLTEPEWESLLPALLDRWTPGGVILVYCDTSSCQTSARIAARLRRELGTDSVYALIGGWEAWNTTP